MTGSSRRRAAALLVRHEPVLAAVMLVWLVATAVTPVLMFVFMGRVLLRLPAASAGWGSPAGHALVRAIEQLVLSYACTVALRGVRVGLGAMVKVRLTQHMQRRLMTAVSVPSGIAHLEDPAVLDRVALAQGTLMSYFPADAPLLLADVVAARCSVLLAYLFVGTYSWWLGGLLVVLDLLMRKQLALLHAEQVGLYARSGGLMRRAFYFRGLAASPMAAKEIRVFGLGDWVVDELDRSWRAGMSGAWEGLAEMRGRVVRIYSGLTLVYVAVITYLAHEGLAGRLDASEVAVVLGAITMAALLSSSIGADVALAWSASALPELDSLERDLDVERQGGADPAPDLPSGGIAFEDVTFRYPGATSAVFEGLDLELRAGTSTAIVGPNGAGKTTLVKLLARLHEPTHGRISADGIDIASLDAEGWRRHLAVVFQDFNRYPLSVTDNVGLGAPAHLDDREGLTTVAEMAGALATIEALPNGWDTILSPDLGGVELSGGEWQRIALARALFAVRHGARILVLDEPTSWLDVRGEAAFYDRFLEMTSGLTTVVISHRFSTVRLADHIYVIEQGQVTDHGSHVELVARGGTYAELFRLQATHFTDDGDADVDAPVLT